MIACGNGECESGWSCNTRLVSTISRQTLHLRWSVAELPGKHAYLANVDLEFDVNC